MKLTDQLRFNNRHYNVDFDHHAQPRYNSPLTHVGVYESGIVTIRSAGEFRPDWRRELSQLTRNSCSVQMVKDAGQLYTPDGEKVVKKYLQARYLERTYRVQPHHSTTDGFNLWLDYDHNVVLPMPGWKTNITYPCEGARPVADSDTVFVVRKPDRKAVNEHMKLLRPRIDTARVVYEMTEESKRPTLAMSISFNEAVRKRALFDFDSELSQAEYLRLYKHHVNGAVTEWLNNEFMTSQVVPFLRIKE